MKDKVSLTAFLVAPAFWILDAAAQTYLFGADSIIKELFYPQAERLLMRLFIAAVMIIFGFIFLEHKRALDALKREPSTGESPEKEARLLAIESSLREKEEQIRISEESLSARNRLLNAQEESLRAREEKIASLELNLPGKEKRLSAVESSLLEKEKRLRDAEEAVSGRDNLLNERERALRQREERLEKLDSVSRESVSEKEKQLAAKEETLRENESRLKSIGTALYEKEEKLKVAEEALKTKFAGLAAAEKSLQEKVGLLKEQAESFKAQETQLKGQQGAKEENIKLAEQSLNEKVERLKAVEDALKIKEEALKAKLEKLKAAEINLREKEGAADIRESTDVKEQLLQSSKMSAVGQLASGVAFEINNSLSAIATNMQQVQELEQRGELKQTDLKVILGKVEESVSRCKNISSSLVGFSRPCADISEQVLLNDIVNKVIVLTENKMRLQGIAIKKELKPDLPMIMGDPAFLQLAFFNLLSRAKFSIQKKSSRDGGTISIVTSVDPQDNRVCLSISDTGVRITEENIGHIFEPFYANTQAAGSAVLDLSFVYSIINEHKATVKVESRENQLTTFRISFPAA
ncbi:MAG: ATP-binding protein [Candidatus Omnitrophica bacterium]|nr:ATP-binding protein [Candidatus Omnitrophota bacterium]